VVKAAKTGKAKSKHKKGQDNSEIVLTIQRVIAKQLKSEPAKITLTSHMQNDLGADSLDALEILFGLEEAFDIKIPEEDARNIVTVQDAVRYIEEKVK
jgi:acyl carrier protein